MPIKPGYKFLLLSSETGKQPIARSRAAKAFVGESLGFGKWNKAWWKVQ